MIFKSENLIITANQMNPGIYVIIGFGENLYGEKSLGSISKIIRSFGKNAIEESEDIDERI